MLAPWKENYDKPRQCVKKKRQRFADKGPYSQRYGFPVVMYGHEFEKTLGVGDGQGGMEYCDSWGHKELDTTERLN